MFGVGPFGEVLFGDSLLFADNDGIGGQDNHTDDAISDPYTDCDVRRLQLDWSCDA